MAARSGARERYLHTRPAAGPAFAVRSMRSRRQLALRRACSTSGAARSGKSHIAVCISRRDKMRHLAPESDASPRSDEALAVQGVEPRGSGNGIIQVGSWRAWAVWILVVEQSRCAADASTETSSCGPARALHED